MPGKTIILCTTLALFSGFSRDSVQAQTRTTRPNDLGIEVLGTGVLFSFSYQRMITSWVGLQVGFTHPPSLLEELSPLSDSSPDPGNELITLGGKFYLPDLGTGSPFATGGIVLNSNSDEGLDPVETENFPFVGLGYEFRPSDRVVFRATLYAFFFSQEFVLRYSDSFVPPLRVTPWPGLHVGYTF
jgi:hypothetical protein